MCCVRLCLLGAGPVPCLLVPPRPADRPPCSPVGGPLARAASQLQRTQRGVVLDRFCHPSSTGWLLPCVSFPSSWRATWRRAWEPVLASRAPLLLDLWLLLHHLLRVSPGCSCTLKLCIQWAKLLFHTQSKMQLLRRRTCLWCRPHARLKNHGSGEDAPAERLASGRARQCLALWLNFLRKRGP